MSKFFKYFVRCYPSFKENVLKGNYREALSIYADAYLKLGEGKKEWDDYWRVYSAAYDGFHRHNSTREQDLREWIGDDVAWSGFMEFFRTRFGQNGICRISNKVSRKAKRENRLDKILRKKQLIDFIKINIRNGILEKEKLYAKAKKFIHTMIIIPPRLNLFKDQIKEMLQSILPGLKANQEIREKLDLLLHNRWAFDNVDNAAPRGMEDCLCWHAAKYINRKGTGRNVPTNALTASLKANPILPFLFWVEKDKKKLLQSFRYQKRANYTESMNYKILSAWAYRLDDTFDRIKTSKIISGPKEMEKGKEYNKLRGIYHQNILAFIKRAMPVLDYLDKRLGDVLVYIIENEDAQRIERLLPEQRKFFESLPNADVSTKEQCKKVFNRIMGIYTFITRVKLISRRDYHDYYETLMKRDKNKKERKWVKPLDESLDVFETPKDANCYIDAVRSLYPPREYVYARRKGLVFPTDTNDTYWTRNGYTLARYDCSGNLCKEPLKGNYVRKKR